MTDKIAPKAAKRLARLIKSIDRMVDMMDHPDIRPLVANWNGSRNLRESLAEFADWQSHKFQGQIEIER